MQSKSIILNFLIFIYFNLKNDTNRVSQKIERKLKHIVIVIIIVNYIYKSGEKKLGFIIML